MADHQNGYQHLEWKPDVIGRQGPYVKDRNILARVLAAEFYSHYGGKNYDAMSKNRELPVEAIREAVDGFDKNPDVAEHDAALERRLIGIKS